jgi:hypothetical protein
MALGTIPRISGEKEFCPRADVVPDIIFCGIKDIPKDTNKIICNMPMDAIIKVNL